MGFFDWLARIGQASNSSNDHSIRLASGTLKWIPKGQIVEISGRSIPGGMFYLGHEGQSADGYRVEPAQIDPWLRVDWNKPNWAANGMTYWPSYDAISPSSRAAYLSWLASDRAYPSTYIGYVFLYFYGLERRVLVDGKPDSGHPDISFIAEEVQRLLSVYGDNDSFRRYATRFLDVVTSMSAIHGEIYPPPTETLAGNWEVPAVIRIALGRYVAAGQAVPAEWALAYVRTNPEFCLRTPAKRCISEFDELFKQRYWRRYPEGLIIKPPKSKITLSYQAASQGISYTSIKIDLPDITKLTGPVNKLGDLVEECTAALDAYSRYMGRNKDATENPESMGLLPDELLMSHGGPALKALRGWADKLIELGEHNVMHVEDVIANWSPGRSSKLTKADAVSMSSVLAKLGVGMEPDVRFGGITPGPESRVVLFPLPDGATAAPSPAYAAAAALVHLATLVASADGSVTDGERTHLAVHLENVLELDNAERKRLEAHLDWLLLSKTGFAGLRKRLSNLDLEQRKAVGHFLVDIAAADSMVSPDEITTLTKLFDLLEIDKSELYRIIHNLEAPDAGPITVREGDQVEQRWAIPSPVQQGQVRLDPQKVQAKLADTAAVTALLTGIFSDDNETMTHDQFHKADKEEEHSEDALGIDGLNATYRRLATRLCANTSWSRADAEEMSSNLGLPLLEGALDRINEAVMDMCGEPLVEGDDPITINNYAQEVLR